MALKPIVTAIPQYLMQQVSGAWQKTFGGAPETITGSGPNRTKIEPWMGPSQPIQPIAPRQDVAGRQFDYPVGYNVQTRPRAYEGLSFETLRGLADGLDLARLCIETRKNQLSGLEWDVVPRMRPGEHVRNRDDPRCHALLEFFRSPDRQNPWDLWLRSLVEDMLVCDAPAIYVRRTVGGDVFALEVIDGATILPLIDSTGRRPRAPAAAYQQILKGVPAINYTTDELLYFPRNVRSNHVYGLPPIQQLFTTINIALRREISKLTFWQEGNIPEALIGVPESWSPDQIDRFQKMIDQMTADQTIRRRAIMVPGGTTYNPTRPIQTLDPQQDEWFARMICYAFGLPPLPLVQQMNRNTSETSYDSALEEGLEPTIVWIKGMMDHIITKVFGFDDIEFTLERKVDKEDGQIEQLNIALVQAGIKSIDEARAEMGLPPLGMGNAIMTPTGPIFIADLVAQRAAQQSMIGHNGGPPLGDDPSTLANPTQGALPAPAPAGGGVIAGPAAPPQLAGPPGQSGPMQPGAQPTSSPPPPGAAAPSPPHPAHAPPDHGELMHAMAAHLPLDMLAAVGLDPRAQHNPDHHDPTQPAGRSASVPARTTHHKQPTAAPNAKKGASPDVLKMLALYEGKAGKKHSSKTAPSRKGGASVVRLPNKTPAKRS